MSTITTGSFPKGLWEGQHAFFGMEYKRHKEEWRELFDVETSEKNYEEDTETPGFGLVPQKAEGSGISYDTHSQGWTKRYTHTVYGMGYVVTRENMEDNLYPKIASNRTRALARSAAITQNILGANVYNRGFNSSYTGGDGKELLATDHPTLDGTQSNELTVAAPLSEASLEDMITIIRKATDTRGLEAQLMPKCLVIPVDLMFEADRILKSERQSGTANNDINAVNRLGLKIVANHFLTDANAWFIKTDCPNGLTWYQRRGVEFTKDNDFDSENKKHKCTFRVSSGWTDWRSLYGTDGGS